MLFSQAEAGAEPYDHLVEALQEEAKYSPWILSEDDEGNLLVLDHPVINEYYEYAMKQRILENLYINGEDVSQKMQLIEQRLKAARNNALSIVNTPDFAEMYKVWQMNRKAQYNKYYDMFKSTDGF